MIRIELEPEQVLFMVAMFNEHAAIEAYGSLNEAPADYRANVQGMYRVAINSGLDPVQGGSDLAVTFGNAVNEAFDQLIMRRAT